MRPTELAEEAVSGLVPPGQRTQLTPSSAGARATNGTQSIVARPSPFLCRRGSIARSVMPCSCPFGSWKAQPTSATGSTPSSTTSCTPEWVAITYRATRRQADPAHGLASHPRTSAGSTANRHQISRAARVCSVMRSILSFSFSFSFFFRVFAFHSALAAA